MACRSDGAHPLKGVPTLLTVDDHAAVLGGARGAPATVGSALDPADLPIVGTRVHGTHPRTGAGTHAISTDSLLARRQTLLRRLSPHRAGRSVVATDVDTMIDYQHRSPTR